MFVDILLAPSRLCYFFFRYFLMDTIKLLASNPLGVAAVTDDRRLKPRQLQTIKRLHIDHQLPTPVVKI